MANRKNLSSKEIIAQILGWVGTLLLGLALYGLFNEGASNLHHLFDNLTFNYGLAISGIILIAIEFKILWPIWKARSKAKKTSNT